MESDTIEEILSRLDARSLMRCKCVCKSWLSLISHPSFKIRHVKHQVPCVVLRLNNSGHGRLFSFRSSENLFDHITHRFPIKISSSALWPLVGSQNGVICLSCSSDRSVYLWNPTIKKLKKLPPYHYHSNIILPTFIHGFGYVDNDFKVVKVVGDRLESCNQVGVYSLGTNSWRTIKMRPDHIFSDDPDVTIFPHHMHSVVVNGCIHWILNYRRKTLEEVLPLEHSLGILAFDLRTEVFKLIDSPAPSIKPFDVESMCNWSGCLSLVTIYRPGLVEIWVMKEHGVSDSWTKHVSVDFLKLPAPSCEGNYFSLPIGLSDNGNLLLSSDSQALHFYDPKSNRVELLCPKARVIGFTTYVESIFLS